MRILLIVLGVLFLANIGWAQGGKTVSRQLASQEIDSIFTDKLKSNLHIEYAIYRVYTYNDKSGEHFIVMTENEVECDGKQKCFDAIRAYCYTYKKGKYKLDWKLRDFILPSGNEVSEEYSISFWTNYFVLDDYDGDGLIDPIMVYGTLGLNGVDDGRVKILVYHRDKKSAIRHQNSVLDGERQTQVDKRYYKLPKGIQKRVREIMNAITTNEHGIFPAGWEDAMKKTKVKFDEN